jgi:type I restriction enzyme S subunit
LEVHFRTNLEVDDILVTNAGTIGRVAIASNPERTKYTTFQKSVAVLKPLKGFVLSEYLALCVESAVSYLKDKSSGTAVKNSLIGDLKQFTVALPSLGEQNKIVKRLTNFFAFTEELKANYQDTCYELDQLDQSILAKAFRGELVPQDPNDEPAAVLLDRIRAEREQLGSGKKRAKAKA